MIRITPLPNAFSAPTKSFESVVGELGAVTGSTSRTRCPVYVLEFDIEPQPHDPPNYRAIRQLVDEWQQDDSRRTAMEGARRWVAEEFRDEDSNTVRTLRLGKGWSQTRLAEELGTSQPHVARIERGTENLALETCRKLSWALGIDMNTLDQALRRQEAIAEAKKK